MFFLEPNYHMLCSSSKNKILILYKVDLAKPEIQSISGPLTILYLSTTTLLLFQCLNRES
jgi:hypothetical protein